MNRALALLACVIVTACSDQGSELDRLYREQKYEEYAERVKQVDPQRKDSRYDERMKVATVQARIQRCNREKDALIQQLSELEAQGKYEEVRQVAQRCRDLDPRLAGYADRAAHELKPETIFLTMSATAHLAEARRLIGELSEWTTVRRHIEAIKPSDKEFPQAQVLLKELERSEAKLAAQKATEARRLEIENRVRYANELERRYLSNGMDVRVILEGADKTTLRLRYILMSRPIVYKFVNESDFLSTLRNMGFKKAVFEDGHQYQWIYDLR